jgi:hypothetical protein
MVIMNTEEGKSRIYEVQCCSKSTYYLMLYAHTIYLEIVRLIPLVEWNCGRKQTRKDRLCFAKMYYILSIMYHRFIYSVGEKLLSQQITKLVVTNF